MSKLELIAEDVVKAIVDEDRNKPEKKKKLASYVRDALKEAYPLQEKEVKEATQYSTEKFGEHTFRTYYDFTRKYYKEQVASGKCPALEADINKSKIVIETVKLVSERNGTRLVKKCLHEYLKKNHPNEVSGSWDDIQEVSIKGATVKQYYEAAQREVQKRNSSKKSSRQQGEASSKQASRTQKSTTTSEHEGGVLSMDTAKEPKQGAISKSSSATAETTTISNERSIPHGVPVASVTRMANKNTNPNVPLTRVEEVIETSQSDIARGNSQATVAISVVGRHQVSPEAHLENDSLQAFEASSTSVSLESEELCFEESRLQAGYYRLDPLYIDGTNQLDSDSDMDISTSNSSTGADSDLAKSLSLLDNGHSSTSSILLSDASNNNGEQPFSSNNADTPSDTGRTLLSNNGDSNQGGRLSFLSPSESVELVVPSLVAENQETGNESLDSSGNERERVAMEEEALESEDCTAETAREADAARESVVREAEETRELEPALELAARNAEEARELAAREAEEAREREATRFAENLLRPLTDEEQQIVQNALRGEGLPNEVLAKIGSDSVQRKSLHTLQSGKWLNDEVVHCFLVMLAKRDEELCKLDPNRNRCHFFKSIFMKKLLNEGNADRSLNGQYDYKNVSPWSKKVPGKDIFALDKIFFPIHTNEHWMCAMIDMQKKKIFMYDSNRANRRSMEFLESLFRYIQDEHQAKKGEPLPDIDEWELSDYQPGVPHQRNGCDCGVFTCMFADFLSRGWPLVFTQRHITRCRAHIALSIMRGSAIM